MLFVYKNKKIMVYVSSKRNKIIEIEGFFTKTLVLLGAQLSITSAMNTY